MHQQWGIRPLGLLSVFTLAVVAAATMTSTSVSGAANQSSEVGISEKEIRIGVMADVENAFQPGLFKGSVDGINGFAKYINKRGGIAGRKLIVDFYDSNLSAEGSRNGIVRACSKDFALVGTTSLFVNNISDLVGCVDKAGVTTGLPDYPVLTSEPVQQCSPVSYPINPPPLDCATKDEVEETYRAQVGPAYYYLKKFKKLSGAYIYPADLKAAKNTQVPYFTAQQKLGIKPDVDVDVSALAPQSIYTPIVQRMKSANSTYARSGLAYSSTVSLRKEAKLQGLKSVKVWDCSLQCYDQSLISDGGADVENQYVYMPFLPFEEKKQNLMMKNFLKYTGSDKADGFAIQSWAAGLFFKAAVDKAVAENGSNSITRADVLSASAGINDFNAGGLIGKTNVGMREPTPCYVLMQVKGGKFVRVTPSKLGTFNCQSKNVVDIKQSLIG